MVNQVRDKNDAVKWPITSYFVCDRQITEFWWDTMFVLWQHLEAGFKITADFWSGILLKEAFTIEVAALAFDLCLEITDGLRTDWENWKFVITFIQDNKASIISFSRFLRLNNVFFLLSELTVFVYRYWRTAHILSAKCKYKSSLWSYFWYIPRNIPYLIFIIHRQN